MDHTDYGGYEQAPNLDQSGGLGVSYSLGDEISALQHEDASVAAPGTADTPGAGLLEASASGSDDGVFLTALHNAASGDYTDPALAQDASGIEGMADPATDGTDAAISAAQADAGTADAGAGGGDYVNPDAEASLNAFNVQDGIENSVYQHDQANLATD